MARLVTSGFEWSDVTAEGQTGSGLGSPSFSGATVRSGSLALTGNGGLPFGFTSVLGTATFARLYIFMSSFPASITPVLLFDAGSSSARYGMIRVEVDGTLTLRFGGTNGTTQVGSASAALSTGTWYRLELSQLINTGTVDTLDARIDGVSFASGSSLAISDAIPTRCMAATGDANMFADDFALNDSSGASQTSWPGSGKVVLLKPISNNAVGTGWTLGTGTAMGNGWDAVDNSPPVGVADLTAGSDTKQIRNASSNANVNYDANLTTYTTAGVGASDTVNVLVPMVATGAPVVTSAKAGTFGVSTNPAIANVSLGAGGTAGAFWSGVAAGTYPTGWKWSFGTTTYAPTVTLGSSPVARITQVTSSTRIADVCAMGMYVDYTPAVVAVTTPPKPTVVLQAVNRSAVW